MNGAPKEKIKRARRFLAYAVPTAALLSYGGLSSQLDLALIAILLFAHLLLGPSTAVRVWPLHAAAWAALLWTTLQALLPCKLTRSADPSWCAALPTEVATHGSTLSFVVPHSLDPANTWVYVMQGVAIVLALSIAHTLIRRHRRYELVASLVIATVVIGAIAIFHKLAGLETLFGIYQPSRRLHVVSPLLNPNHFGAVTGAGALLAMGLALHRRRPRLRPWWVCAAALGALCVAWSGSRAAAGAFVVGAVLFYVLLRRSARAEERAPRTKILVVSLGAAAAASVIGYFSPLRNSIENSNYSKPEAIVDAASAVIFSPLFGTGRGAFSSLYTKLWGNDRPYFPENLLVTWAVEWGVLFALTLALVLLVLLARAALGRPKSVQAGAIAATLSLVVHDFADFALEMTGIAVFAALCLGTAVMNNSKFRKTTRQAWIPFGATAAVGCAALVIGLLGYAPERAEAFVVETSQAKEGATVPWRRAAANHPNDPAVLLIASRHAEREESNALAVQLVNRAMLRAPSWPGPHIQGAILLAKAKRVSQAMLELRRAEELKSGSAHRVLCQLAREDALRPSLLQLAIPTEGVPRYQALSGLWRCLPKGAPLEEVIYKELADADKKSLPAYALQRLGRKRLEQGDSQLGFELLERSLSLDPKDESTWIWLARALADKDAEAALRKLDEGAKKVDRPVKILLEKARHLAALDRMKEVRETLSRIRSLPSSHRIDRANAMHLLGQLESQSGNLHLAIEAFRSAERFGHTTALRDAYLTAAKVGRTQLAQGLQAEHCRKHRNDPWCTKTAQPLLK